LQKRRFHLSWKKGSIEEIPHCILDIIFVERCA
jgi:hypothetical protein